MLFLPRWQKICVLLACLLSIYLILPNFFSSFLLPDRKINLGLDLQGGVHLAYEADLGKYFSQQLVDLKGKVRENLRPRFEFEDGQVGVKRIFYRNLHLTDAGLQVDIIETADVAEAQNRLEELGQKYTQSMGQGSWFSSRSAYTVKKISDNTLQISFSDEQKARKTDQVMQQVIEVLRRRVDAFGTREPNIFLQGHGRVIIQVPGLKDVDKLKNEVGKTAQMTFHLVEQEQGDSSVTPAGAIWLPLEDDTMPQGQSDKKILLEGKPILTGDNLVNAVAEQDSSGNPAVGFTFDALGARKFGDVTSKNIGRPFAIVLDGKVISAPVIQSAIYGGSGIITGNFTIEKANDLALLLRAGALPVPLTVVEERNIGAELGADSVQNGQKALIVGFALVAGFMIVYYGRLGVYAVIALIINTCVIFGLLSILSATLTLPGIAGIVLGMGVAVDANVLINERIREELAEGISLFKAIEAGYERAWATIIDSHVTSLAAGLIMFFLGAGPIRGFAITLCLGVLASLFTAVWITRILVVNWLGRCKPQKLSFGLSERLGI